MAIEIIKRGDALAQGLGRYFTGTPCPSGHLAERYTKCTKCTECIRFRHKRYQSTNSAKCNAKSREYRSLNREALIRSERKRRRSLTLNGWIALNLTAAKKRSRERGFDFDINRQDLKMPDACPYFGQPFVISDHNWRPSLDRIDPAKGYVRGNVQIISMKANRMKNDGTLDDLIQLGRVAARQKQELGL